MISYLDDFKDIKGNENIKRFLEIALLGNHRFFIKTVSGNGYTSLCRAINNVGYLIYPNSHFNLHNTTENTEMYNEMNELPTKNFFEKSLCESNESVANRLKKAFEFPRLVIKPNELNSVCKSLLTNAADKFKLSYKDMAVIIDVAITIAQLELSNEIRVEHIAESIQYSPKIKIE